MFEEDPCWLNSFEVFGVDPTQVDLKVIRERERDAREMWEFNKGRIKLRNGREIPMEEARLNDFKKRLFEPLLRLRDEQFVHPAHPFAGDAELLAAVDELRSETVAVSLPSASRPSVLGLLKPLVPPIDVTAMEDDLPWPPAPESMEVLRESLEEVILRDV